MERILLKHITGSKANQVEVFPLPMTSEIIFGRDSSAQVRYDPNKDDVVSRKHARIEQDPSDPSRFTLSDLNSRNGTYLNHSRVTGVAVLTPGDVIQLGANGPEVMFDVDPRPETGPPVTRLASSQDMAGATREAALPSQQTFGGAPAGESGTGKPPGGVGRATVERLIEGNASKSRKTLINAVIAVTCLLVIVASVLAYMSHKSKKEAEEALKKTEATLAAAAAEAQRRHEEELARVDQEAQKKIQETNEKLLKTQGQVQETQTNPGTKTAQEYIQSTVYIEASWKLIEISSGKQLFHWRGDPRKKKKGQPPRPLPVYIMSNNYLEPYLVTEDHDILGQPLEPIGNALSGSGFIVTDNGFILTNKHVAAAWDTKYYRELPPLPFYVVVCQNNNCSENQVLEINNKNIQEYIGAIKALMDWIPSKTSYLGGRAIGVRTLEGRNDYLYVKFPHFTVPTRASLERRSDNADVALLKVEVPHSIKPVQMSDVETLKPGDMVTVIGYPAVSPDVLVKKKSYEPNSEGKWDVIPEPSVTIGNVQKIIKADVQAADSSSVDYWSEMGDVYQLAINTTGSGNSGGPVFNTKGEVIGIFTYGLSRAGAAVTFAVPIKHGQKLMGIGRDVQ